MYCKKCGNQMEENAKFCDKCGETNQIANEQRHINILAVVGFMVACISLLFKFWGITGVIAVILSLVGLIRISKSGEKGKGLAIAGIAIGAFSMVWTYIVIFIGIFSYVYMLI